MSEIESEVRAFIVANFLFGQTGAAVADDQSFLESGIVDSTGVLELVAFLEERFDVTVADRELLPENLDSIRNVVRYVTAKQQAKAAGAAH